MSIKRTREHKQLAEARRIEMNNSGNTISLRVEGNKGELYSRELVLPVEIIKKDLVKTGLITILAIVGQLAILGLIIRGVVKIPGV